MLDFLFAVGQFICVIGLLYGLVLTIVNRRYAGSTECRFDPAIGQDWCRDMPDERLQFMVVPEQSLTIKVQPVYRDPRELTSAASPTQRTATPPLPVPPAA